MIGTKFLAGWANLINHVMKLGVDRFMAFMCYDGVLVSEVREGFLGAFLSEVSSLVSEIRGRVQPYWLCGYSTRRVIAALAYVKYEDGS